MIQYKIECKSTVAIIHEYIEEVYKCYKVIEGTRTGRNMVLLRCTWLVSLVALLYWENNFVTGCFGVIFFAKKFRGPARRVAVGRLGLGEALVISIFTYCQE